MIVLCRVVLGSRHGCSLEASFDAELILYYAYVRWLKDNHPHISLNSAKDAALQELSRFNPEDATESAANTYLADAVETWLLLNTLGSIVPVGGSGPGGGAGAATIHSVLAAVAKHAYVYDFYWLRTCSIEVALYEPGVRDPASQYLFFAKPVVCKYLSSATKTEVGDAHSPVVFGRCAVGVAAQLAIVFVVIAHARTSFSVMKAGQWPGNAGHEYLCM